MATTPTRRRKKQNRWIPITILSLLGLGAVVGTLYVIGDGELPWSSSSQAKADDDPDRAGKRPYPRAVRSIPAFTGVRIEHLLGQDAQPSVVWLDPKEAQASGLLETRQVLGRVLRDDHKAGYGFTERAFLPAQSQESWTAAIPEGMSGVQVSADQVPSLRGLRRYDRFVLVAAAEVRSAPAAARSNAYVPTDVRREAAEASAFHAPTRVVVDDAVILVPISGTPGARGQQAAIAVPNEQYAELMAALAKQVEVTVLAKSGNPLVQAAPLPEPEAPPQPLEIRVVNGGKVETILLSPERAGGRETP